MEWNERGRPRFDKDSFTNRRINRRRWWRTDGDTGSIDALENSSVTSPSCNTFKHDHLHPAVIATNRRENPFHAACTYTPCTYIYIYIKHGGRGEEGRVRGVLFALARTDMTLYFSGKTCSASSVLVAPSATPPGGINYLFRCFICLTFG